MKNWPILKHYDEEHIDKVALPLGGIGTGTISLGGRGDFRDCEILNTPAKNKLFAALFFCINARSGDDMTFTKLLEGPFPDYMREGASGAYAFNHGLPRFRHATFEAAYPFGQVNLSEPTAPVDVTLQAFNPLIPADADASGFPAAVIRYIVRNKLDTALQVSLCGTATNVIDPDNAECSRKNTWKRTAGLSGITFASSSDTNANSNGEYVLATPDACDISWRENWLDDNWNVPLLDFWDDFSEDGRLENRENEAKYPGGSLCLRRELPAGGEGAFTFIFAWRFPNRRTWTPLNEEERSALKPGDDPDIIGNYYCTRFDTAWNAAAELASRLEELEGRTLGFVKAFLQSPVPKAVKEAALFNVSTLRTQTAFRTPDGKLFGWEGCSDSTGSCFGSCTHVWNYEQTTPFLFGNLARGMREVEFLHATKDNGFMCFRVGLPLSRATKANYAAADGQLGCLIKVYRDWKLSGDDAFLKQLWPKIRLATEFIWHHGSWDADCDGIMEGCQHNTMDVEYFGPNGQMQGWYVCALKAVELMATYLGEAEFAEKCRGLCEAGCRAMDEMLFNGEYYRQIIQPVKSEADVIPELRGGMGTKDLTKPVAQLGNACLVDQLVGPYVAHIAGLPELLNQEHVKTALNSIWKYNRRIGFWDHFNNMRSFVTADDTALLMASYPHGDRPKIPFPYFTEVMTGFEYTAAIGMLYEGLKDKGIQVIEDIRRRYDGKYRSPFDEAECGHHYARAMAAWGAYLALSGFHYDGVNGTMTFDGIGDGAWFWSTGYAFGTVTVNEDEVQLSVIEGSVKLETLCINGTSYAVGKTLKGNETASYTSGV